MLYVCALWMTHYTLLFSADDHDDEWWRKKGRECIKFQSDDWADFYGNCNWFLLDPDADKNFEAGNPYQLFFFQESNLGPFFDPF